MSFMCSARIFSLLPASNVDRNATFTYEPFDAPLGRITTYTLVLTNSGAVPLTNAVLTDTYIYLSLVLKQYNP